MYQHGFHWTDFYDILYSKLLLKCVGKTKTSLQWGKDFGQFTRTFNYFLLVPATLNRHKKALFEWNGARLSVRLSVFLFVPMSVCLSVCPYIFKHQRRSHWKNLREISYRELPRKAVEENHSLTHSLAVALETLVGFWPHQPTSSILFCCSLN